VISYWPIASLFLNAVLLVSVLVGWRLSRKRGAEAAQILQTLASAQNIGIHLENAQRKTNAYFLKIDEVLKERDSWRDLYNDQSAGHENAQALMMSTIAGLSQAYTRETGKVPQIDPLILQVQADWQGAHGASVRESLGTDGKKQADELRAPKVG